MKQVVLFLIIIAVCAVLSAQERPTVTQADYDRWLGNCTATSTSNAEWIQHLTKENADLKAQIEALKKPKP